jgi:lipopolysaccharide/colanic/teichoic acid biosynthesis glycosyltransferase
MSLVGPRPLPPQYLPRYTAFQRRRHDVKPGITGWAQVKGRNSLSWAEKFKFDVWYVENQSLFLDFAILCMTVVTLITCAGISAPGHVTMPQFTGTSDSDEDPQ